ncbi:MAG: TlpA disulfide reductase family protein [Pseudomonadales bacterium]
MTVLFENRKIVACPAVILFALLVVCLSACTDDRFGSGEAPDFTLPLFADKTRMISLSDLRGKVVYLTIWASWCEPCHEELPYLNELRHALAGRGFEVLAINVDEEAADAQRFLRQLPVDYPVLSDVNSDVLTAYRVQGLPTHFLIDRGGIIRTSRRGFSADEAVQIRTKVVQLLDQSD